MKKYQNMILFTGMVLLNSSFGELIYSQPFYNTTSDKQMQEYGWSTLNETTTGLVENAVFVDKFAIGCGRGAGAADIGAVNATWPEGITPRGSGYPYFAPNGHSSIADFPSNSSCLVYTTITNTVPIEDLGKLNLHQRADNVDSIIRFTVKVGGQWYASEDNYGGRNTGWALKEMEEFEFENAANWREITLDAMSITVSSNNPSAALTGNIEAYGMFLYAGVDTIPGKHARIDNFQIHRADANAFYIAGSPTDWTDPAAWSDGNAAHAGTFYFATNSVVLETPATTTTFPGDSLGLTGPQRMGIMTGGADMITVSNLTMTAADLAAGVGASGEATIDGAIDVASSSTFSGATDDSRDLRVLSLVSGSASVELSAPTQTIFIDNTNNTFSGTWIVSGGTGEFTTEDALGLASIEVGSNGTLRINSDWDGYGKGDSLTVADSPNALVDLGTNDWTVSSLMLGTSNVPGFITYTVPQLNALSVNPLFTGSGTVHVGAPPQPQLLVGWERWVDGLGASCPATIETSGFAGSAVNGGFAAQKWGGSSDGTFGTLLSPTASLDTSIHEEGMRVENATEISFDFTVGNTSGDPVDLGAFHFDALTKTKTGGPDTWTLEVLSGDVTIGEVTNGALPYIGAASNLADFDVDLTGLADSILDAGGSVEFRLTFSGGTPAAVGATRLDMDNVALTKVLSLVPTEPAVMSIAVSGGDVIISWPERGFKLQTKAKLSFGDWVNYPGGDVSPVTIPATKAAEFYRLIVK